MHGLSSMKGSTHNFGEPGSSQNAIHLYQSRADYSTIKSPLQFGDILHGQRRSEFDVSNTVCVSDTEKVCLAIKQILVDSISSHRFQAIEDGFDILDRLYGGDNASYHRCETDYHNKQHVLDVTLATARLIWGYQQEAVDAEPFSEDEIIAGILVALFHDVGYLREKSETSILHGAEFTKIHVSRGADFLKDLLQTLGLPSFSISGQALVHFTGYEKAIEDIEVSSTRLKNLGFIIGTADVIAQMADRAYLEKCEAYLYPEFLLGGLCVQKNSKGKDKVVYSSAQELMQKTPQFMSSVLQDRLTRTFDSSYRFAESYFQGVNLYLLNINKNYAYLNEQLSKQKNQLGSDAGSVILRRTVKGA